MVPVIVCVLIIYVCFFFIRVCFFFFSFVVFSTCTKEKISGQTQRISIQIGMFISILLSLCLFLFHFFSFIRVCFYLYINRFDKKLTDRTAYMPFLQGPRDCVVRKKKTQKNTNKIHSFLFFFSFSQGQYFALLEGKIVLSTLIKRFIFKTSSKTTVQTHPFQVKKQHKNKQKQTHSFLSFCVLTNMFISFLLKINRSLLVQKMECG